MYRIQNREANVSPEGSCTLHFDRLVVSRLAAALLVLVPIPSLKVLIAGLAMHEAFYTLIVMTHEIVFRHYNFTAAKRAPHLLLMELALPAVFLQTTVSQLMATVTLDNPAIDA